MEILGVSLGRFLHCDLDRRSTSLTRILVNLLNTFQFTSLVSKLYLGRQMVYTRERLQGKFRLEVVVETDILLPWKSVSLLHQSSSGKGKLLPQRVLWSRCRTIIHVIKNFDFFPSSHPSWKVYTKLWKPYITQFVSICFRKNVLKSLGSTK